MVSVIIPMYNCERYIKRCIDSLVQQTYSYIEVLVVDDGSTDKSADIVRHFQKQNTNIKYIYQTNSGPGVARNTAIEKASGKYLLFVDADDYLSCDYIFDLVDIAEKNKSELTIGGYTWIYENKDKQKTVIPQKYERDRAEEWAYRISASWGRLYLFEFWKKHELKFNTEKDARAEDVPIVLFSNLMAKNISIAKNAGYFYYQHQGSAMNNKKKVLFDFPYDAFEKIYNKTKEHETVNSIDFFRIGLLKFFAQFDLVIYRKASQVEKNRFRQYVKNVIGEDYNIMVEVWKKSRMKVKFPILHKIAIQLFVWKYISIIER